jgi:hypothetical protein
MHGDKQNGGPLHTEDELASVLRELGLPDGLTTRGIDLDRDHLDAYSARLAGLELALRDFRTSVLTPRAVGEQIAAHHLDWIRVNYQSLVYPAEAMAREAILCVREDGMDFLELAATTDIADLRDEEHWIGEITGALHAALLGARPGDVVGPFSSSGGHALLRLTDKRLPSVDDEQVRTRAEQAALRRALTNELQARVRWIATF